MKNTKRISGRIALFSFMCVAFIVINAYGNGRCLAQSVQESGTPAAPTPIATQAKYDSIMYAPGDLRKDNADIAARTRFDPVCNAMITVSGDYEYGYSYVVGGLLITKYTGSSSVVHIPEMIDGMPVRGIGVGLGDVIQAEYYGIDELNGDQYDYPFGVFNKPDDSYYQSDDYTPFANSSIVEVYIPNGVEEIYNQTFNGCKGLTSIMIPDSVVRIADDLDGRGGWGAFEGIPNFSATYRGVTYTSSDELYDAINGQ